MVIQLAELVKEAPLMPVYVVWHRQPLPQAGKPARSRPDDEPIASSLPQPELGLLEVSHLSIALIHKVLEHFKIQSVLNVQEVVVLWHLDNVQVEQCLHHV